MFFMDMILATRDDRRVDDPTVRRVLKHWKATGAVPVAHIVADLGAVGEPTGEFETVVPAPRRHRKSTST